jgi:hypothetical protein
MTAKRSEYEEFLHSATTTSTVSVDDNPRPRLISNEIESTM